MGWGRNQPGNREIFINISVIKSKTVFNCQDSINKALRQTGESQANLAATAPSLPLDAAQEFIFMGHFQAGPFGRLE